MKTFTCIVVELIGRGQSVCALKTENHLLLVVGQGSVEKLVIVGRQENGSEERTET